MGGDDVSGVYRFEKPARDVLCGRMPAHALGMHAACALALGKGTHQIPEKVEQRCALRPLARCLDAHDVFHESLDVAAHGRLLEAAHQRAHTRCLAQVVLLQ
jgi:hypothetical protein